MVDGAVLNQTPASAFKSGSFNRVPVISGSNHDEYRLLVADQYDFAGNPLTDADYPAAVATLEGGRPVSDPFVQILVNTEYPLSNYPPPQGYFVSAPLALGALGTDEIFVCTARNADLLLSKYVPTYTYEFNDETAPSFFPPGLSFPQGDSHFIELEYLFDVGAFGIAPAFNSDQQELSDTMISYWTQFARFGNPNSEGLPFWPRYTAVHGNFESLVAPVPTTLPDSKFDADHKCSSFWNTF